MKLSELITLLDERINSIGPLSREDLLALINLRKKLFAAYDHVAKRKDTLEENREFLKILKPEFDVDEFEWDDLSQPVALLDVDHTVSYFDEKGNVILNQPLLDSLKKQGIKDVYLFTDMTFTGNNLEIRKAVIDALQAQGFTVHGVISPNDYLWNKQEQVSEFISAFDQYAKVHNISLKNKTGLEHIQSFFDENEEYKELLTLSDEDLPELGSAYQDVDARTEYSEDNKVLSYPRETQDTSYNIKFATDVIAIARGLPPGKDLLFEQLFAKMPAWINRAIFFDDKEENIESCERVAKEKKPKVPMFASRVYDADYTVRTSASYQPKISEQDYESTINKALVGENSEVVRIESNFLSAYRNKNLKNPVECQAFDKFVKENVFFTSFEILAHAAACYATDKTEVPVEKLKDEEIKHYLVWAQRDHETSSIREKTSSIAYKSRPFDKFLREYNNPKNYSNEIIGIAASIYAQEQLEEHSIFTKDYISAPLDQTESEECISKAKVFLERKQKLLDILNDAMVRSQQTIDYLTPEKKEGCNPTFMDRIKVNKLHLSEEKLKALQVTINYIQKNVFDNKKLENVATRLTQGSSFELVNMGQHPAGHYIAQKRGWRQPKVITEIKNYLKDEFDTAEAVSKVQKRY